MSAGCGGCNGAPWFNTCSKHRNAQVDGGIDGSKWGPTSVACRGSANAASRTNQQKCEASPNRPFALLFCATDSAPQSRQLALDYRARRPAPHRGVAGHKEKSAACPAAGSPQGSRRAQGKKPAARAGDCKLVILGRARRQSITSRLTNKGAASKAGDPAQDSPEAQK
jgi:hypothetical protein